MKANRRTVTVLGADRAPGTRMPALSSLLPAEPMPELVIEKGVPVPTDTPKGKRSPARIKLDAMEPGDSLLIPTRMHSASAAHVMVRAVRRANPGREYTSRLVQGGVRVWRTA